MSSYKFDDTDIQKLKRETDYGDLFSFLGIEYKKTNNKYYDFLCPFHSDTHFGSAKVDIYSKKCKCFVCDRSFSPLDLIMEINNKNFHEALIDLADLQGCLWEYEQNEPEKKTKSQYPLKRLTTKQKELLGFVETELKNIISVSKGNLPNSIYDVKRKLYMQQSSTSLSWNYLYVNYPNEYRGIVLSRCYSRMEELKEKISSTETFLENYQGECKWFFAKNLEKFKKDFQEIEELGNSMGLQRVMSEIKKQT